MQPSPAIDYTNKDYASLRQAMLDLARYRLPEWTDQGASDPGVLLVDLFAYMGDVILYYQDRIANELFLPTATERRSVLQLLRLIGYELMPAVASAADLTLTFKAAQAGQPTTVTVPHGAQFATKSDSGAVRTFEYLGPDLQIDLTSTRVTTLPSGKREYAGLPVRQGRGVPVEGIGSSRGEPNQSFALSQTPLIPDSLVVEVNQGAGWVRWERRDNLLYHTDPDGRVTLSGPDSTEYYVQVDENDVAWVVFGDGQYGRIPAIAANNIRATYSVGGGAAGNVAANAIVDDKTGINQLDAVTNPAPAAGGMDRETIDHAVRFGPLAFRSGQRAVTLDDFVSLAHQAGGVAKVRARSRGWNRVDLFVAPAGDTCRAAPDDLKQRLIAYFEDKRMVGTFVHIQDPTCVGIEVGVEVIAEHHYNTETVRQSVETAVRTLLAFDNVDFGRPLYLSKVYEAIENLPGVAAATVTQFRRNDRQAEDIAELLQAVGARGLSKVEALLRRSISVQVAPDGRIDIGDFELPTLVSLDVTATEVVR